MALPSVWRSEFAGKPTGSFSGFHWIDELDNALVDVFTSGILERSNVKTERASGNAAPTWFLLGAPGKGGAG
jgi:hypothetical protein